MAKYVTNSPGDPGKLNSGLTQPGGIGVRNSAPQTDRHVMDDYEYGIQVQGTIEDSVLYIDGYISPDRALAQSYYLARLFGNEQEGRSQVVMTEVRDTILTIVPELLRIFTASSSIVQFVPNSARTEEEAGQATDYVNHIFWHDNNGFQILHNAFKDALTVRTGIIKWRWDEDITISEAEYTDLSHEQLMALDADEEVEVLEADPVEKTPAETSPSGEVLTPAETTYDVKIRRKRTKKRVVLECVPPEEFLCDRETRDLDTSRYIGHRSLKTVSDLVAMGYDRDDIEGITNSDDSYYMTNLEAITRNPAINIFSRDTGPNSAMKRFVYVESWIRIDRDGDGIAELRKTCTIGPHLLHDEVATDVPFAVFCPDPTPHMLIGQSVADQTMDLQLIKSSVVRDVLDSLKQSVNPRTWIVEGQVNTDDALNNEIGALIRMRQPGMAGEFTTTFQGQAALPVIQYLDFVKQSRTGISDASRGLDPDALQSSAQVAVDATVQGARARIEMVCRLFAGDGMTRLMKGIYRMVIRHQDKPRIVQLRGKFIPMDPRFWDADLDVVPNVALGRGDDAQKLQFLTMIHEGQKEIITTLGIGNPLVPIDKYRETWAELCHIAGFKDETKFFAEVDPKEFNQQLAEQAKNKPPDPTTMLAQIEQQKVQNQADKQKADAALKGAQIMADHAQADKKMHLDAAVRIAVAQITATGSFNETQLEAFINHDLGISTAQIQAAVDQHAAETQAGVDQHANLADMAGTLGSAHIAANAPQPESVQ